MASRPSRPVVVCCGEACEIPAFVDLRGLLSFWLLWELRLGPLLGAQLAERMAWRRGNPLSPGTLYPALAALERQGLVAKRRDGRDTVYRLTPEGQRELACARLYLQLILADVMGTGDLPLVPGGTAPGPAASGEAPAAGRPRRRAR